MPGVFVAQPASGHDETLAFSHIWEESDGNISWRWGNKGDLSASYATLESNFNSVGGIWNGIPNNAGADTPNFVKSGSYDEDQDYVSNPCNLPTNVDLWVFGAEAGGAFIARQQECESGSDISRSSIRFDDDQDWHVGSGSPGAGEIDFRGVEVHETGHTLGFDEHYGDHVPNTGECASSPAVGDHTMCSSRIGLTGEHWRSPETHDIHTVDVAYK